MMTGMATAAVLTILVNAASATVVFNRIRWYSSGNTPPVSNGDALNWFQAVFVAIAPSPVESFSYASLLIHGQDLLIAARTSLGGKNHHDTNLVTLHRVKAFRVLVPGLY